MLTTFQKIRNKLRGKLLVRHLNGDTDDNRAANLAAVSLTEAWQNLSWKVDWILFVTDEERDFILEMFMKTPEIYTYMKFRAALEEVPFELEPIFFKATLHRGVRRFFGVETDSEGTVLRDPRSPDKLCAFWSSQE
jgi:hypothetical protein